MLRIEYTLSDEGLSESEKHAEIAHKRLEHCFALFNLLKIVDLRRALNVNHSDSEIDIISESINSIGELGSQITDKTICHLYELNLLYDKQSKQSEEAVSLTNTEGQKQ